MAYLDGFVIPVKKSDREIYRTYAAKFDAVFKEFGALSIVEAWGDDLPMGELTSFPRAVHAADDETVVFSWILWPDRAARDAGNAKIMEDPRMQEAMQIAPFDGKRMIFGGFETIVEL
jgi:uncharacterized protein YbaA (DUF1428 family)